MLLFNSFDKPRNEEIRESPEAFPGSGAPWGNPPNGPVLRLYDHLRIFLPFSCSALTSSKQ